MTRIYVLLMGFTVAFWLLVATLLYAEAAEPPASPADLSPRVIVTEIEAGALTVVVYRGLGADLAVLLAPAWVRQRTRAVVTVEGARDGVVFALDRKGRLLCAQTGQRDVTDMLWEGGMACGW